MNQGANPLGPGVKVRWDARHAAIARIARALWMELGRPVGRDQAIWLEAEDRLRVAGQVEDVDPQVAAPKVVPARRDRGRS